MATLFCHNMHVRDERLRGFGVQLTNGYDMRVRDESIADLANKRIVGGHNLRIGDESTIQRRHLARF